MIAVMEIQTCASRFQITKLNLFKSYFLMSLKLTKCLVAELLGTTLLLATVIGSGIMAERLSEGNEAIALLGNTIATGAILYVLITMFGSISGAHFNPAVTLSFLLLKEIKPSHASLYIIFQLVGAIAGMMLAHGMFEENFVQVSTKIRTGHGQWLSEGVATFGCTVVCGCLAG